MAEETTLETTVSDLQEAKAAREAAKAALEEAQAAVEEKIAVVQTALNSFVSQVDAAKAVLSEEAAEEAEESEEEAEETEETEATEEESTEEAVVPLDAIQEKLDELKDAFAELAAEAPNEARRKLRLVWGAAGLVLGACAGVAAGWYLWA